MFVELIKHVKPQELADKRDLLAHEQLFKHFQYYFKIESTKLQT